MSLFFVEKAWQTGVRAYVDVLWLQVMLYDLLEELRMSIDPLDMPLIEVQYHGDDGRGGYAQVVHVAHAKAVHRGRGWRTVSVRQSIMWMRVRHTFARALSTTAPRRSLPRIYRYWIDVHGQLFLYDTVPKNLTSCRYCGNSLAGFKSIPFLNFFYARVVPNPMAASLSAGEPLPEHGPVHWTEDEDRLAALWPDGDVSAQAGWDMLWRRMQEEGMSWVSPCQGEWNMIHAVDTPIVYRHLSPDGRSSAHSRQAS